MRILITIFCLLYFCSVTSAQNVSNNKVDSSEQNPPLMDAASVFPKNPLYIIDDKQIPDTLSKHVIQNLNHNDILGISILKDASATALYGLKGANGVITITTKTYAIQQYKEKLGAFSKKYKNYLQSHQNKDDSCSYLLKGGVIASINPVERARTLYNVLGKNIKRVDIIENPFYNGGESRKYLVTITTKQ